MCTDVMELSVYNMLQKQPDRGMNDTVAMTSEVARALVKLASVEERKIETVQIARK